MCTILSAKYRNLPMIPLGLENNSKSCFWNEAFGFSVESFHEINAVKSLLHQAITNLSASQKELLLWHQHLSHVSVKWLQKLMCNRKWLPGMADNKMALHSGPFIPTKKWSRAQLCNTSTLKCTACLYAKASTRSPENLAPRPSFKKQVLKQDHLKPGDCISADHYFSPIIGQIPHTFGKEQSSYTCGSLFVDHASGKIFNFPQYSTNALKLSKIPFDWKHWLWKKDSRSRNITPTTESFLQLNSKSTARNNIKSTRLVALR